jgi:hypothetical protein
MRTLVALGDAGDRGGEPVNDVSHCVSVDVVKTAAMQRQMAEASSAFGRAKVCST